MAKKKPDPAPLAGHNSTGVTNEVFNKHLGLIEKAEAACEIANKHRTTLRKAARAEGIILGIFDAMRKMADLPRAEQVEKMGASRSYLVFLRSPVGSQMTFDLETADPFNETDDAALARIVADAEAAGYRAGLAGVVWEDGNPHEVPSDAGQAWVKGYRDGQAAQVEALGDGANTGA